MLRKNTECFQYYHVFFQKIKKTTQLNAIKVKVIPVSTQAHLHIHVHLNI